MVLRRCRRLLGREDDAVDAMHDTFVQLLQASGRLDERGPSALLFRIATNVCLSKLRVRKRRPETVEEDLLERIAALGDVAEANAARSVLARLLGREPASTALICVMHLLDDMTHEQVAAQVGLSVSGVRKRLRTVRARLHELEEEVR
jgi:RNA polymerase sigma-70 factor (ECF subfamily)